MSSTPKKGPPPHFKKGNEKSGFEIIQCDTRNAAILLSEAGQNEICLSKILSKPLFKTLKSWWRIKWHPNGTGQGV